MPLFAMVLLLLGRASDGSPQNQLGFTAPWGGEVRDEVASAESSMAEDLDVRRFGAVGDGVTDDTRALQAALDHGVGKRVVVPPGTFLVHGETGMADRDGDAGGLRVPSNVWLRLSPGAVLRHRATGSPAYKIVRIGHGASNVRIDGGGVVQGDRASHDFSSGGTHEWGYCLAIIGGVSNVVVENVTLRDCTGDGLSIHDRGTDSSRPRGLRIRNVLATNNRRQGMSIVGASGVVVEGGRFELTSGTPPQSGIDLEPGGFGHRVSDVTLHDVVVSRNAGRGIVLQGTPGQADGPDVERVAVHGGRSEGNVGEGIALVDLGAGTSVLISGMTIRANGRHGLFAHNVNGAALVGNLLEGNGLGDEAPADGMLLMTSTGLQVAGNVLRSGAAQRYGINVNSCSGTDIARNDLSGSGGVAPVLLFDSPSTLRLENIGDSETLSGPPAEVSEDRGDVSAMLEVGSDAPVQRWATALTRDRKVVLSNEGAVEGSSFRIIRTGLSDFSLDVGGLKTIPRRTAAWVEVTYDGRRWRLTGYRPLDLPLKLGRAR